MLSPRHQAARLIRGARTAFFLSATLAVTACGGGGSGSSSASVLPDVTSTPSASVLNEIAANTVSLQSALSSNAITPVQTLPFNAYFFPWSSFTAGATVVPTSSSVNSNIAKIISAGVATREAYAIEVKSGHPTFVENTVNGAVTLTASNITLVAGNNYSIFGTYDGATASLYVNGVLAASAKIGGGVYNDQKTGEAVGADVSGASPFNGLISNVVILPTAMSAAAVAQQAQAAALAFAKAKAAAAATPTPAPLATHTATPSPVATHTPVSTPTPVPPVISVHVATPTPAPIQTSAPTPTPTPVHTATPTAVPTHTPTPTPVTIHTPTPTPVPTLAPTPVPIPTPVPTLSPGPPSFSPLSLSFLSTGSTRTTQINESNYSGSFTVSSNCSGIATVTQSGSTVSVRSIGAGSCTVTATDTHAQHTSLPVTVTLTTIQFQ
jgi:hypothetical protein